MLKPAKISPIIFQRDVHLNNLVQRQYFQKKYFKHTKELFIANEESRSELLSDDNIRNRFVLASRRLKAINHLNLSHSDGIVQLPNPKLLQIMKRFRHMRHLSLFEKLNNEKQLKISQVWLMKIKKLASFKGNVAIRVSENDYDKYGDLKKGTMRELRGSWSKLKRAFVGKDLKRLHLKVSNSREIIPAFSTFPRTLEEISIIHDPIVSEEPLLSRLESHDDMQKISFVQQTVTDSREFKVTGTLKNFKRLRKLKLMIPLDPEIQRKVLDSIRNPSKLAFLGINVGYNSKSDDDELCSRLERFLKLNLKSMQLKFFGEYFPACLLEKLEEFGLEHLKISIPIQEKNHMSFIGRSLARNQSLKALELKVKGKLTKAIPAGSFQGLFEGIGELSGLEALNVNIDLPNVKIEDFAMKSFSDCLPKLVNLKELSYVQGYKYFGNGFEYLAQALSEHCGKLRTLEIVAQSNPKFIHWGDIEKNDMDIFYEALRKMKELEKLVLTKFSFSDGGIKDLLTEIAQIEKLREVYLDVNTWMEEKGLTKRIKKILENECLRDFVYTGETHFDDYSGEGNEEEEEEEDNEENNEEEDNEANNQEEQEEEDSEEESEEDNEDIEKRGVMSYKEFVCKKPYLRRVQVDNLPTGRFESINYVK